MGEGIVEVVEVGEGKVGGEGDVERGRNYNVKYKPLIWASMVHDGTSVTNLYRLVHWYSNSNSVTVLVCDEQEHNDIMLLNEFSDHCTKHWQYKKLVS